MASIPAVFVLCVCFKLISGYALVGDDENEIIWPTEYHFNGDNFNFVTGLKAPLEMWYSAEQNRSRIDFYGGSTKKYYYGDLGIIYTMIPTTDENLVSDMICMSMSGGDEQVNFLPDVSAFTRTGETMLLFDKQVDVWTTTENYNNVMLKEQTLYVYRNEHGVDLPVQHISKNYYTEIGAIASHTVVNYYNFRDSVSEKELENEASFCVGSANLGTHFKNDIQMLHPDIPQDVDIAFDSFARHHAKQYEEKERQLRRNIFEENWRMVNEHNRKNLGYKLELNHFSDKMDKELSYLTGTFASEHPIVGVQPFPHTLEEIDDIVKDLPEFYDLRLEGAVSSVKNQGSCGSCWAFATTAALEGAISRNDGGRLFDLSEQSLVDCAWTYDNYGCYGGTLDGALKYVLANGIPTEEDYGVYMEHDGFCKILNMTNTQTIKGFAMVTPRNPNALKVALYKYGPVTIAIYASPKMIHYSNGLYYDFSCETARINHGVTVIGYGNRNGQDYWIVKNSWGESWGEDGYILMSAKNNNCLVLDTPYYPIV